MVTRTDTIDILQCLFCFAFDNKAAENRKIGCMCDVKGLKNTFKIFFSTNMFVSSDKGREGEERDRDIDESARYRCEQHFTLSRITNFFFFLNFQTRN